MQSRQEVRRVLLITLLLNFIVAGGKILLGIWTGALSITADGFHSLVDGLSNIIALVANRLAERPPDDDHPYGHRRYETIAALAIGGFLLFTAWEIIVSAWDRLAHGGAAPTVSPLTFAVMLATLGVNLFVSSYEIREGKRLKAELLIADAAHTRTDVYVTLSVLVSLGAVALFNWVWADTLIAILIVGLILRAAWQILRQTGRVLVDTAPYTPEYLLGLVRTLPSVENVLRARSRGTVDAAHIDIDVQVAPEMTAEHTAAIAESIRQRLHESLEGVAEVEVHFEPQEREHPDYALAVRAIADAQGLATHEVSVHEIDDLRGKVLELHVEVPAGQTLAEAHQQVSQLEVQLHKKLPDVVEVVTHIEPATSLTAPIDPPLTPEADALEAAAFNLLSDRYPAVDWHALHARPHQNGFNLTMHATLPPQITIESAHQIAEAAEILLRTDLQQLDRVTIHTEPADSLA